LPNVTLIGEKQAKAGNQFFYLGSLGDCRDCKVKTVCFNLESGRLYRIKEVRPTPQHECKIHEGRARAIEYEKVPFKRGVPAEVADATPTEYEYDGEGCKQIACEHHEKCRTLRIPKGEKYKVVAIGPEITCPDGRKLREITIE
jgi:uncharacterized protein (UPF0179 family)